MLQPIIFSVISQPSLFNVLQFLFQKNSIYNCFLDMHIFLGAAVVSYSSFWLSGYLDKRQQEDREGLAEGAQGTFFKKNTIKSPLRQIKYPHYTILYSTFHKSPVAVHEFLTKEVADGDAPRAKYFYADDHIKQKHFQADNSYFWETKAYYRFNLNRGHMAAAGNYSGNIAQKFLTFTFANIVPQDGTNNGGIWNTFERYSRNLLFGGLCDSVEVISGPIYAQKSPLDSRTVKSEDTQERYRTQLKVLKQNGMPIPAKLYKIILCKSKEQTYFGVYENYNKKTQDNDSPLKNFEVKLQDIQVQTGLKFNIKGKPLREIDNQSLSKTKKEHDYPFYYGLMANAQSVRQMSDGLRRAYSQDIEPKLEQFTQQIRRFTIKQCSDIESQTVNKCQKLRKVLSLGRKLHYMKHGEEQRQMREAKTQQYYAECRQNQEELQSLLKDYKSELSKLQEKKSSKVEKSQNPQ